MLVNGLKPSAALRAAQLELSKQKQFQAPFYWAGFVIQGDWQ
jgi:CHAT domain-containing protein